MTKNYLIGIGGSGSRVIESVIHLCAAGYGPEELNIFIIDPDEGNGNLDRTRRLLKKYQNCYSAIDRSVFEKSQGLFATNVKTAADVVWNIFRGEIDQTLAGYLHYVSLDQSQRDLVSVFYSQQELGKPLNEGFRGHPSIGAAVMSNPPRERSPWREFWDDVEAANRESDIRVFVAGSVFGGTGAAGVPTFGADQFLKLDRDANLGDGKSKVFLGGALIMPYFTFDHAGANAGDMFVTAENFPIATKAALHYYDGKDLSFDRLYFIGDSLMPDVGLFSPGNIKQKNRPHYIEMATALAAFDFFRHSPSIDKIGPKYFLAAREAAERVTWADLPISQDQAEIAGLQNSLKSNMINMAAFSLLFSSYLWSTLSQPHNKITLPWYKDHFSFKADEEENKDPRLDPSRACLLTVTEVCREYLQWVWEIGQDGVVDLLDPHAIGRKTDKGWEPCTCDAASDEYVMGRLIRSDGSSVIKFENFVSSSLNTRHIDIAKKPSDKLIGLFYQAACDFCKRTYGLTG